MGLFDKIFGGGKVSTNPDKTWDQQSPFLRGLYERAYGASMGMGTGGSYVPGSSSQVSGGAQPGNFRGITGRGNFRGITGRANTQPAPGQPGQQPTAPGPYGVGYGGYQDPLSSLGVGLTSVGSGMLGQLGILGQSGNPFAQAQIGQLGQGLGRLYQQQIVPGITSQFAGAGQLGGSRQALALGQAGEGLGQAFTGGALDILGNSAQLALNANQYGLGGLQSVFNAGNAGMFGSLPGLATLLGGPTVLGGGGSSNTSNGIGGVMQGAASLGLQFCAVARLVFGADNPEWLKFYAWKEARPWFRRLYNRHCFAVADWMADKPRVQRLVRRWMRHVTREN